LYLGRGIDFVWVWEVESLGMSAGNEQAINRQITKGKGKKNPYISVLLVLEICVL